MLTSAPTGAPWSDIPLPQATNAQQAAEQTNICWRATNMVDAICNQPLRCTLNAEQVQGPDYRLTVDASGVARVMTSRWPVLSVLGARVSPRACIPRQWSVIPASAVVPEEPPMTAYGTTVEGASGAGGQALLIAPGYLSWLAGRNGYTVEVDYLNGWPHAGIANAVLAGANQVQVDDVTGFTGAAAFVYDSASTEVVTVLSVTATNPVTLPNGASVPVGPGTLTLSGTLAFGHAAGVVVSAMPQDISWAGVLLATAQVLESGATSITVQNITSSEASAEQGSAALKVEAEVLLAPYKRVI
jgi:hypothetical protein